MRFSFELEVRWGCSQGSGSAVECPAVKPEGVTALERVEEPVLLQ